ncbi:MAG: small subunit ribosomal protein S2, partial [Saprospiraceae bacterium]
DGTFDNISKRERLAYDRQRIKLERNLGSIADLTRLPAALFIVDVHKEHIAVAEARKLNIPTFAIVDTNSNPNLVDFPIPANDDSSNSVKLIIDIVCEGVKEGLGERKATKEAAAKEESKKKSTEEAKA